MCYKRNIEPYKFLTQTENRIFFPFAVKVKSMGKKRINQIGKKIIEVTDKTRATEFLFQRISFVLQKFYAGCIIGTFPDCSCLEEVFLLSRYTAN